MEALAKIFGRMNKNNNPLEKTEKWAIQDHM